MQIKLSLSLFIKYDTGVTKTVLFILTIINEYWKQLFNDFITFKTNNNRKTGCSNGQDILSTIKFWIIFQNNSSPKLQIDALQQIKTTIYVYLILLYNNKQTACLN